MPRKTLLAIALATFTGAALAAPTFAEADKDANGSVSKEEAAAVEGLDFAAADANADGALSPEEYEAATKM